MKQKTLFMLVSLGITFLLAGCECKHNWVEQGCGLPNICSKCNVESSTYIEHNWVEQGCGMQNICSKCNATSPDYLDHNYYSTCVKRACSRCGETQPPEGHSFTEIDDQLEYCAVCGVSIVLPEVTEEMRKQMPCMQTDITNSMTATSAVIFEYEVDACMSILMNAYDRYIKDEDIVVFGKVVVLAVDKYDYLLNDLYEAVDSPAIQAKVLSCQFTTGSLTTKVLNFTLRSFADTSVHIYERNLSELEQAIIDTINSLSQFYYGTSLIPNQ